MQSITATLAAALAFGSPAMHALGHERLKTEAGFLEGVRAGSLTVYRGVPFAAPPVGSLRWRAPQQVKPWTSVRQARTFAPACMQTSVSMPGETPPKVSEDCLYLNVWVPAHRPNARLPVMVWIHGGGFSSGSAAMPLYWGDQLTKRGVIMVTVAYRLGPLGFLAHPELSRESVHAGSGDYGLMDQIAALKWVKRNIAAFGGDPARVTVLGQSAGATSVSLLMASPAAKDLFQRAVAESGGVFEPVQLAPGYLLPNAEKAGQAYAASLGLKSIHELRALPVAVLFNDRAASVSHPVIGPDVLPVSPYQAFAEGRQNDVPLLVGSNEEEARSLVDLSTVRAATWQEDIKRQWGELPAPLLDAYPHATDEQARQARAHFERDLRFGWDIWAWARLQAQTGRSPVFYYHFSHSPPFPAHSVYAGWGPSHYAELWYVFDHLNQEPWAWTATDRTLADVMSAYWTNFAKMGNPNGAGLPSWPDFTPHRSQVLQLGDPIATSRVADIDTLKVFDGVYDQVRGSPFSPAPTTARVSMQPAR